MFTLKVEVAVNLVFALFNKIGSPKLFAWQPQSSWPHNAWTVGSRQHLPLNGTGLLGESWLGQEQHRMSPRPVSESTEAPRPAGSCEGHMGASGGVPRARDGVVSATQRKRPRWTKTLQIYECLCRPNNPDRLVVTSGACWAATRYSEN